METIRKMTEPGKYKRLRHEFGPVFDEHSSLLILGSFPSVKSREQQFYYGHPQNRFWKVLAALMREAVPETVTEKKEFLLHHQIAVWDVIEQCDIIGSSDSSIKNVVPVDLSWLLRQTQIVRVFTNGGKAYQLYQKYLLPVVGLDCVSLPSTSPANASWSTDRLIQEWRKRMDIGVSDER